MALKNEEIEAGIKRKNELNSFLERYEVKSREFANLCNLAEQNMYAYRKGGSRITDKMWKIMQAAMKKYEAENIVNGKKYQILLDDFIKRYKVPIHKLAVYSDITEEGIRNYLSGTWAITDRKWLYIKQAMKRIKEENSKVDRNKRPNLVLDYMVKNLKEHHNTIVMKKHCAHREDELLDQLAAAGCDCNMTDTESDHYMLEIKGRWNK